MSRFICIILFVLFINQNAVAQQWYKGNLHTHSYWSDGDDFPEMIMGWYKSHDYDFVALSDHNILAQGEKWKLIPKSYAHEQGFERYLAQYGDDWVQYKKDTAGRTEVKLKTLEEYGPLFEEEGKFLIIPSEEITDSYEDKPIHMNATNIKELIEPQGGKSVADVMQNNLDQVYAQRKRTGQPMFPHINHPNFGWAITVEDMMQLQGERFFEVYNGHPLVNNYGDSLRPGTEQMWDQLLTHYIKDGKPLLYGLATDDAHSYHLYNSENSNPGRGWVMVRASSLTPAALIEAMENGDFYATTGVVLEDIQYKAGLLSLQIAPEEGIDYTIQFWGSKQNTGMEKAGMLLKEVKGKQAQYQLQRDDLYVRAKIISTKPKENPYQEGDVETAWTQPVTSP